MFRLNTNKDVFHWNLHQHENFSIHSMYLALITNGSAIRNNLIWRLKIPLKIKKNYVVFTKGGCINKGQFSKKELEWGGGVVVQMRLSNIYFFIVIMLSLCGAYQTWCLT
jgi:hypothetical protein